MSTTLNSSSRLAPSPAGPTPRWRVFARSSLPNWIVFSALGAVMLLGHHTGWKLPRLSELTGASTVGTDDWCSEHLVPESECIECLADPASEGQLLGFCKLHGVAECVTHHPQLAQVQGDPQLPKYDTVQAISVLPRPENNSRNTLHTRRIQFTSAESVEKSGIDVDVVQERPMTDAIAANGELIFDPTRVAHLSTRVPGTLAMVLKTVGDAVSPDEILALVDCAQVGQAKTQLQHDLVRLKLRQKTVQRLRELAQSGAVPGKSLLDAESALQEAEIEVVSARQTLANLGFELPDALEDSDARQLSEGLRFLGIPSAAVAALPTGSKTANLIPIRAPYGGVIVDSEVVAGEFVETSQMLFTVADPSRLWLRLSVRQEDVKYVRPGLPVRFRTDDGGQDVTGEVSWISPAIDEQTRTTQVRVVLANPDNKLRDKTFGAGQIILREQPDAIVVPREAVQSTSDAHFVFVRDKNYFVEGAPKFFHVRQVRIGAQNDQFVELLAGVLPGEVIATKGSAVLLAQLLRSNLGAGCGCHDH